ncbi:CynX/NimT family MFS transporter [Nitrosomonas sp.]|uniref:MFS transporter n=1 Tax=Nitrosomonas sp. TaxID=42353 RepID=UPI0025F4086B|nr:MFS transporter [Nitrosomonas sp.]
MTDVALQFLLVFAMTLPMLILYATSTLGLLLSSDLGFEATSLGYLIMSSFGLAAVLSLYAGRTVDCYGSRQALLILFCAVAMAFSVIAVAVDFYSLLLAAAMCGIAQALSNPVTNSLIAQQISPQKKAWVVGLKQSGVQLAALIAGLALPAIALQFGWRTAFAVIVPVALLFLLVTVFMIPRQHVIANNSESFTRPNALLGWLMAIQFCVAISLSAFVTFLPTFATQHGMELLWADTLIAAFGVMGMLSRILLTPIGAKLKDESLLLFALIAVAACTMILMQQTDSHSHWRLWIGAVGMGFTAVATNAIAMSMLIRDAGFGAVTTSSSYVSVAFFSGFALGPPLYGMISNYFGNPRFGWGVMIGVLIIACTMTLLLANARRQKSRIVMR